jgi:hypothetical protein
MKWKMFDEAQRFDSYCKPHDLILAEQVGLRIPDTLITDNQLLPGDNIYKPVLGGAHTQIASSKGVFGAGIGFVQKRMIGQEYRAYVVGSEVFAFRMETKSLDYREKQDVNVVPVPLSDIRVADKVRELSHRKGLYFSATDLKEDDNGQIHFLEINSAPMFSEFDKASGGNLTDAMISWLGA